METATYETYLTALLAPLGVYDFTAGSLSEAELYSLGRAMDAVAQQETLAEREAAVTTAQEEGLVRREALFAHRPAAPTLELRRAAIAALMQISGDGLTLAAINRAIVGCGIPAVVEESGRVGYVRVRFPGTIGVPEGYEDIQKIILDILPCHLETDFYLRYLTWAECEAQGFTWAVVEAKGHTWHSFELAVPDGK